MRFRPAALFAAGFLLANALPHLAQGTTGHAFPSPFASPPSRGMSSPTVNALWGCANLAAAYVLAVVIGRIAPRQWRHVAALMAGFTVSACLLAGVFGRQVQ